MRRLSEDMGRSVRTILTILVAMVAVLATASTSPGAHPRPAFDGITCAAAATAYVGDLVGPAGSADTADHAHDVPYAVLPMVQPVSALRLPVWVPNSPPVAERGNNILFDRPPRST